MIIQRQLPMLDPSQSHFLIHNSLNIRNDIWYDDMKLNRNSVSETIPLHAHLSHLASHYRSAKPTYYSLIQSQLTAVPPRPISCSGLVPSLCCLATVKSTPWQFRPASPIQTATKDTKSYSSKSLTRSFWSRHLDPSSPLPVSRLWMEVTFRLCYSPGYPPPLPPVNWDRGPKSIFCSQ